MNDVDKAVERILVAAGQREPRVFHGRRRMPLHPWPGDLWDDDRMTFVWTGEAWVPRAAQECAHLTGGRPSPTSPDPTHGGSTQMTLFDTSRR